MKAGHVHASAPRRQGGASRGPADSRSTPSKSWAWQTSLRTTPGTIQRRASCPCGGSCPRCQGSKHAGDALQGKLRIGAINEPAEREADRVADAVMRMPDAGLAGAAADVHAEATGEFQRKESGAASLPASLAFEGGLGSLGSGAPLPASERDFFEPRFGRSFAYVRVHTDDEASHAAQAIGARAFTLGNSIVMGEGAYAPGTHAGRTLLGHELTHVVQQEAGELIVRRQTISPDCRGHEDVLRDAWAEGLRLTVQTIESLNTALFSIGMADGTVPSYLAQPISNAFGDVGLTAGFSRLPDLIRRYETIRNGFQSGRTLRCDISTVPVDQSECDRYAAFVIPGNSTDIFICPSFFESHMDTASRGTTLLHEMAHSALGIAHRGGVIQSFDCGTPIGLEYDDAKRNAYAYDILANCLHGSGTQATDVTVRRPAPARASARGRADSRWSISAAAGADITPGAERLAAALGGQVSLRTGEFVVFNPVIGLNLLYLPSSGAPIRRTWLRRPPISACAFSGRLRVFISTSRQADMRGSTLIQGTIRRHSSPAARPPPPVWGGAGKGWNWARRRAPSFPS